MMKKYKIALSVIVAALVLAMGAITLFQNQADKTPVSNNVSKSKGKGLTQIGSAENSLVIDTSTSNTCQVTQIEKYSRFLLYEYERSTHKKFYIQQDFEIGTGCFEGYSPASITVTAKNIESETGKLSQDIAWAFDAEGVRGGIDELYSYSLYKVEMPGCCGAAEVDKYYSLKNGKLVISSTIQPLKIDIANTEKLGYIGVHGGADTSNKNSIATIIYGTNESEMQKISIQSAKSGDEEWIVEKLKFSESDKQVLTLFKREDFKGISIDIELNCRCDREPVKIVLTMNGDRINAASAQISGADDMSVKE